ncbi:MAG: EFR1 family ferrodoxin [Clostridium sp.]|jgi:ferredoxin/flavodoxin|uniref:EFR1 family ferrodoxin n=1 Tax=Clostridium sp. TaxID=1506 RepID=UPI0025C6706D|nr:EFR1 family ferrodoxin [Clostridium sp.]MCH3965427.1 EFR1 family ferrodoxin [Clostridium sp.]MCI1717292.1 EFR1 family ferrodoxin [Clostridium sp.]MCI1801632.1 EFR1 family ferrodoxin [Clostridium sp.]MCI1815478.1 EFR1 family ferrodoxin [Clostridium sp.]MCI1872381.1 EFR1 family ferrodoxin [Clostridium sp.]
MKGVLYYFSGTGNTKWAADRFRDNFKTYGVDLKLISVEDTEKVESECFKKNDFIVIGSPVHAEFPPKIMCDFLRQIKPNNRKIKAIVYSTQSAKSSSAPCFMSKYLKKKGYRIVIQTYIKMPNNYYFAAGKKPDKSSIENLLSNAEAKIEHIVKKFMHDKILIESNNEFRVQFSKFFNKVFRSTIPKLSQNISSTEQCGKCGICLMNCPKKNITFENGHAVFNSKCILCMRCIHICPINAIRYKHRKIDQTQKNILRSMKINE